MKLVLTLIIAFLSVSGFTQHILKGVITTSDGDPIPGVKVYLDSTTYGVISDYSGAYFIELKAQKKYPIVFKMLGYNDSLVWIDITKKTTVLDLQLVEESTELASVEVSAKKDKVGNSIIKKVQKNRKRMAQQFENYVCDTYLKTGLEKKKRRITKKDTSTTNEPSKMSLIESVSVSTYIRPNTYHEKIVAQHDYSDKEKTRTASVIDYFNDDQITPVQAVLVDPYIFFEKLEDGDFDLYQNMIDLPKVSEHPITSPIGIQAFTNYKFKLVNILFEDGQKIYEIKVTPRLKTAPLFSGSLYIIDELWVIKSFNLSINSAAMPFFKSFTVIQDYAEIKGFWVPIRREFSYVIIEELDYIMASTRVDHSNYQFNKAINNRTFNNELSSFAPDAFMKDSTYWNKQRPIRLKKAELEFIAAQVKIDSIKQSEHYLDSIDAAYNRVKIGDVFLNGVGFRNRFKKQEIRVFPLLQSIEVLGVGGFRYNFGGSYSKKFMNAHQIKVTPQINVGFLNKDIKPQLALEYTFLPIKFGKVALEGGSIYERLTNQLNVINFVYSASSSIRNNFIGLAYRQELVNGLYGRIKFSYANKQPLTGLNLGPITDFLTNLDTLGVQLINDPIQFEPYQIALVEFKLQYRFKQKYIIKNNEKLIVGSAYPEIELTFKQGIPKLFNSEVSFNLLEFRASDEINLGNYGDSKWNVIGGTFLNKKDLRIIEHRFFKRSDGGFLSNPLQTHQTLDTALNTNGLYSQGFFIHHFNGFFLNKIPVINRLKFEAVAGVNYLYIKEANLLHTEFLFGVERKFRMFNELFKYGIYYTGRFDNMSAPGFQFKIGLDFFNTFTNQWSY